MTDLAPIARFGFLDIDSAAMHPAGLRRGASQEPPPGGDRVFRVEIRVAHEDGLSRRMADMREWLDHRRSEPVGFRNSPVPGGTAFRVEFKSESEAIAFAAAFAGEIEGTVEARGHSMRAES